MIITTSIKAIMTPTQQLLEFLLHLLCQIFSCTPVQVVSCVLFFYYGVHEVVLEAIATTIDIVLHIVEVGGQAALLSSGADCRYSIAITISK